MSAFASGFFLLSIATLRVHAKEEILSADTSSPVCAVHDLEPQHTLNNDDCTAQLTSCHAASSALADELKAANKQLQGALDTARASLAEKEKQLNDAQATIKQHEHQLVSCKSTADKTQEALNQCNTNNTRLAKANNNYENGALNTRIEILTAQNSKLDANIQRIQAQNTKLTADNARFAAKAEMLQNTNASQTKQIQRMQAETDKAVAKQERLETTVTEQRKLITNLTASNAKHKQQIEDLSKQNQHLEQQLKQQQSLIAAFADILQEPAKSLVQSVKDIAKHSDELKRKASDIKKLKQQNKQFRADMTELNNSLIQMTAAYHSGLDKIGDLEHELGECNVEWSACDQSSRQAQAAITRLQEDIDQRKQKNVKCIEVGNSCKQNLKQCKKDNKTVSTEWSNCTQTLKDAMESILGTYCLITKASQYYLYAVCAAVLAAFAMVAYLMVKYQTEWEASSEELNRANRGREALRTDNMQSQRMLKASQETVAEKVALLESKQKELDECQQKVAKNVALLDAKQKEVDECQQKVAEKVALVDCKQKEVDECLQELSKNKKQIKQLAEERKALMAQIATEKQQQTEKLEALEKQVRRLKKAQPQKKDDDSKNSENDSNSNHSSSGMLVDVDDLERIIADAPEQETKGASKSNKK